MELARDHQIGGSRVGQQSISKCLNMMRKPGLSNRTQPTLFTLLYLSEDDKNNNRLKED
ncbi:MAG: hypothetical protein R3C44_02425 [Chloroflexota bacterium]